MLRTPRSGISLIVDLAKRSADDMSMEGKNLYPFIRIANRKCKDRNVTVGNTNFSFDKNGIAKVFIKGPTIREDIQKAIDFHGFSIVEEKVSEPVALVDKVVDNAVEVPVVKEVIDPTPVAEEKLPEIPVV